MRAGTWILFFFKKGKSVRVSRDVFFFFLVLRVHRQTATSCCVDGMYACAS